MHRKNLRVLQLACIFKPVKAVLGRLLSLLFLVWGFPHILSARVIPDSAREALFLQGLELTVQERFGAADSLFRGLVREDPGDPWGHFFWAVGIAARMMDAEQDSFSAGFSIQLSIAQQLVEKQIKKLKKEKKEKERPDLHLLLGNIWGYRAIGEYRRGYWYGGLKAGLSAKKNFDRALEIDSNLYDAYNGLGNYHFWKSDRTRKFPISAFVPDDREKGIEQLVLAKDRGFFSRHAAAASLLWAFIRQKNYQPARRLADSMAVFYPEAKSFLWARGTIYHEQKMWDSSAAVFSKLLKRLEADPTQSGYNFVECRFRLAEAFWNSGRYQEALWECETAKAHPLPSKAKKRLKSRFDQLAEISKKSKKALAHKDPG